MQNVRLKISNLGEIMGQIVLLLMSTHKLLCQKLLPATSVVKMQLPASSSFLTPPPDAAEVERFNQMNAPPAYEAYVTLSTAGVE